MSEAVNISSEIERIATTIPFTQLLTGSWRVATQAIIETFSDLGKSLNYTPQVEWLYDLIWFREENGMLSKLPMVMECEWNRGRRHNDECDTDFQKLVQARADVRLWISTSPDSAETHIENCKRQARAFGGAVAGDRYVFAVYDWTKVRPLIEQFRV